MYAPKRFFRGMLFYLTIFNFSQVSGEVAKAFLNDDCFLLSKLCMSGAAEGRYVPVVGFLETCHANVIHLSRTTVSHMDQLPYVLNSFSRALLSPNSAVVSAAAQVLSSLTTDLYRQGFFRDLNTWVIHSGSLRILVDSAKNIPPASIPIFASIHNCCQESYVPLFALALREAYGRQVKDFFTTASFLAAGLGATQIGAMDALMSQGAVAYLMETASLVASPERSMEDMKRIQEQKRKQNEQQQQQHMDVGKNGVLISTRTTFNNNSNNRHDNELIGNNFSSGDLNNLDNSATTRVQNKNVIPQIDASTRAAAVEVLTELICLFGLHLSQKPDLVSNAVAAIKSIATPQIVKVLKSMKSQQALQQFNIQSNNNFVEQTTVVVNDNDSLGSLAVAHLFSILDSLHACHSSLTAIIFRVIVCLLVEVGDAASILMGLNTSSTHDNEKPISSSNIDNIDNVKPLNNESLRQGRHSFSSDMLFQLQQQPLLPLSSTIPAPVASSSSLNSILSLRGRISSSLAAFCESTKGAPIGIIVEPLNKQYKDLFLQSEAQRLNLAAERNAIEHLVNPNSKKLHHAHDIALESNNSTKAQEVITSLLSLDDSLLIALARHPRLLTGGTSAVERNALYLLDTVAFACLHDPVASRIASLPLLATLHRVGSDPLVEAWMENFVKKSLSMLIACPSPRIPPGQTSMGLLNDLLGAAANLTYSNQNSSFAKNSQLEGGIRCAFIAQLLLKITRLESSQPAIADVVKKLTFEMAAAYAESAVLTARVKDPPVLVLAQHEKEHFGLTLLLDAWGARSSRNQVDAILDELLAQHSSTANGEAASEVDKKYDAAAANIANPANHAGLAVAPVYGPLQTPGRTPARAYGSLEEEVLDKARITSKESKVDTEDHAVAAQAHAKDVSSSAEEEETGGGDSWLVKVEMKKREKSMYDRIAQEKKKDGSTNKSMQVLVPVSPEDLAKFAEEAKARRIRERSIDPRNSFARNGGLIEGLCVIDPADQTECELLLEPFLPLLAKLFGAKLAWPSLKSTVLLTLGNCGAAAPPGDSNYMEMEFTARRDGLLNSHGVPASPFVAALDDLLKNLSVFLGIDGASHTRTTTGKAPGRTPGASMRSPMKGANNNNHHAAVQIPSTSKLAQQLKPQETLQALQVLNALHQQQVTGQALKKTRNNESKNEGAAAANQFFSVREPTLDSLVSGLLHIGLLGKRWTCNQVADVYFLVQQALDVLAEIGLLNSADPHNRKLKLNTNPDYRTIDGLPTHLEANEEDSVPLWRNFDVLSAYISAGAGGKSASNQAHAGAVGGNATSKSQHAKSDQDALSTDSSIPMSRDQFANVLIQLANVAYHPGECIKFWFKGAPIPNPKSTAARRVQSFLSDILDSMSSLVAGAKSLLASSNTNVSPVDQALWDLRQALLNDLEGLGLKKHCDRYVQSVLKDLNSAIAEGNVPIAQIRENQVPQGFEIREVPYTVFQPALASSLPVTSSERTVAEILDEIIFNAVNVRLLDNQPVKKIKFTPSLISAPALLPPPPPPAPRKVQLAAVSPSPSPRAPSANYGANVSSRRSLAHAPATSGPASPVKSPSNRLPPLSNAPPANSVASPSRGLTRKQALPNPSANPTRGRQPAAPSLRNHAAGGANHPSPHLLDEEVASVAPTQTTVAHRSPAAATAIANKVVSLPHETANDELQKPNDQTNDENRSGVNDEDTENVDDTQKENNSNTDNNDENGISSKPTIKNDQEKQRSHEDNSATPEINEANDMKSMENKNEEETSLVKESKNVTISTPSQERSGAPANPKRSASRPPLYQPVVGGKVGPGGRLMNPITEQRMKEEEIQKQKQVLAEQKRRDHAALLEESLKEVKAQRAALKEKEEQEKLELKEKEAKAAKERQQKLIDRAKQLREKVLREKKEKEDELQQQQQADQNEGEDANEGESRKASNSVLANKKTPREPSNDATKIANRATRPIGVRTGAATTAGGARLNNKTQSAERLNNSSSTSNINETAINSSDQPEYRSTLGQVKIGQPKPIDPAAQAKAQEAARRQLENAKKERAFRQAQAASLNSREVVGTVKVFEKGVALLATSFGSELEASSRVGGPAGANGGANGNGLLNVPNKLNLTDLLKICQCFGISASPAETKRLFSRAVGGRSMTAEELAFASIPLLTLQAFQLGEKAATSSTSHSLPPVPSPIATSAAVQMLCEHLLLHDTFACRNRIRDWQALNTPTSTPFNPLNKLSKRFSDIKALLTSPVNADPPPPINQICQALSALVELSGHLNTVLNIDANNNNVDDNNNNSLAKNDVFAQALESLNTHIVDLQSSPSESTAEGLRSSVSEVQSYLDAASTLLPVGNSSSPGGLLVNKQTSAAANILKEGSRINTPPPAPPLPLLTAPKRSPLRTPGGLGKSQRNVANGSVPRGDGVTSTANLHANANSNSSSNLLTSNDQRNGDPIATLPPAEEEANVALNTSPTASEQAVKPKKLVQLSDPLKTTTKDSPKALERRDGGDGAKATVSAAEDAIEGLNENEEKGNNVVGEE